MFDLRKNMIVGTPIPKLAMVKIFKIYPKFSDA